MTRKLWLFLTSIKFTSCQLSIQMAMSSHMIMIECGERTEGRSGDGQAVLVLILTETLAINGW